MLTTVSSIFVLVFSTPDLDAAIGLFLDKESCEEAATLMIPHISAASVYCKETPPCPSEDSDTCFWDGDTRGNGEGVSFVAW